MARATAGRVILGSILDDFAQFVSGLGSVRLGPLLIAMACFVGYLSLRALAWRNILQAAYPHEAVRYQQMWGAYLAAYGFNNVIPARGGDVLKFYLTKTSIPTSTYPTVGAALLVEAIFDLCAGALAVLIAVIAGVFPSPPSWLSFNAVDLSFIVSDGRRALFLLTAAALGLLMLFALVALRVRAFWARVRQGFAVLRDRRLYLRTVWGVQGAGWLVRGAAFFFFLRAFGMPATVENVCLVLSANAVAAIFPFTPGGAGVVQAMLLELFNGKAAGATVAAYGVGQQAAVAILSLGVGFFALAWVFEVRSFREAIERGRADREAARFAEQPPEPDETIATIATRERWEGRRDAG
ncbi:MAG: lysylphosphatidylglycerol synthase transmembrane domain-containing protein [Patulibacter sp.]